jgi:hypothetical protein
MCRLTLVDFPFSYNGINECNKEKLLKYIKDIVYWYTNNVTNIFWTSMLYVNMCEQPIKVLPPPATAFDGSSIYPHMIWNAKYIAHLLSISHPLFIWTIPHMFPILVSVTLVSFVFICMQSTINWKIKTPKNQNISWIKSICCLRSILT